MLTRLSIENLALVGSLELELGPGLNVITGETGAGKSVLVDSLALLVGERADTGVIRSGESRAMVEGVFELDERLRSRVSEIAGEDLAELSLRREIARDQRSRCFVAGRLASAALLRELGEELLELHGQHEHQLLLRTSVQRDLLDSFADVEADRLRLGRDFRAWRAAAERLSDMRLRERERAVHIAALREVVNEIAVAEIDLDREAERRIEADRLRHLEDRTELSARVLAALHLDEREGAPGALEQLRTARAELHALARDEPRFAEADQRLTEIVDDVEELSRELGRYVESLIRDPVRLAELDARETLLLRLGRRHATDLAGLLARAAAGGQELGELEREAGEAEELELGVLDQRRALMQAAVELSRQRVAAAGRLERAVRRHLRELEMGSGDFQVCVERLDELDSSGLDRAEFLIAPNPGEPAAPLRSIASGGELSRVILALKAALAAADRVPTLVFDEIDSGIGGRVAYKVADRLATIGRHRQVIAVTHLAQIAAPADRHLRVEKVVEQGRARITAAALEGDARVEELSRMLGGDPESDTSRRHARELLSRQAPGTRSRAEKRRGGASQPAQARPSCRKGPG